MRMIKADRQPVSVGTPDRWCYPAKQGSGGLYFTYPDKSVLTGALIPCKGGAFDGVALGPGLELVRIECA